MLSLLHVHQYPLSGVLCACRLYAGAGKDDAIRFNLLHTAFTPQHAVATISMFRRLEIGASCASACIGYVSSDADLHTYTHMQTPPSLSLFSFLSLHLSLSLSLPFVLSVEC